jgi:fumarate hydratase class II
MNVYKPLMIFNLMNSIVLLADGLHQLPPLHDRGHPAQPQGDQGAMSSAR